MKIEVNGEGRQLEGQVTVAALLELLGVAGGPVAVERNRQIVPRAEHASTLLADGDQIEVVQFVGGG